MKKRLGQKNSGFTLIEILITIVIFTSIIGLVIYFGLDISSYGNFISESISSQNELQLTLNTLETEIRSMGPSSVGGYPIEAVTSNSLIFYSDIDTDGLFERVRYFLNGNIFMKGVVKPTGNPLTYNLANEKTIEAVHYVVTNPANIFSYYGKRVTTTDILLTFPINPNLIRAIKVDLASDRDVNALPGPTTFSIFSTIRNLRTNQ